MLSLSRIPIEIYTSVFFCGLPHILLSTDFNANMFSQFGMELKIARLSVEEFHAFRYKLILYLYLKRIALLLIHEI